MYNDISLRKKGFYGEGVPANSGVVVTVKTHGHTTEKGAHMPREYQVEYNHHNEVNHSAILLIRNPFNAIIGKITNFVKKYSLSFVQVTEILTKVATQVLLRKISS